MVEPKNAPHHLEALSEKSSLTCELLVSQLIVETWKCQKWHYQQLERKALFPALVQV
jgi:hypothetical protein